MKRILFILFSSLFMTVANSQMAGDYRSAGTVLLTTTANWETYSAGSWAAATTAPNAATFTSGNTITILAAHTWNNTAAATVPEGVTLLFQGTGGAFSANTLTINGTYIHASATAPSTVFTAISTATGLGVNSTVVYRASASYATPTASLGGRTYNNLTFDTDGTTVTQPSFSSPGFTTPVIVNGTLLVDTWKADFYTASSTVALNLNGDVTLTGTNTYLRIRAATIATGKTLTINATDSLGVGNTFALTINGTLVNKSTKPISFSSGATLVVNGTYQHDANGGSMPNSTATYNAGSTILVTGITTVSNIPVLPAITGNVIWNSPGQTLANTFVNTTSNSTTVNGNLTIQSTGTANIYLGGAGTARTLTVNGNLIVNGGKLGVIKPATAATGNQVCTVNGDVIVSSGTFFIADEITGATGYTGKGYLNVTGSINHTGGVFGTGAVSIPGTSVLSFTTNNTDKTITTTGIAGATNVVVDKTATGFITLNSNAALAAGSTITFTTGKLAIAGNAVLEVPSAASISGASATSYIVTNTSGGSTGSLKMSGVIAAAVFPVGTSASYLPVTLTPLTSSDFTVGVFQGVTKNALPNGTAVTATQKTMIVDAVWVINRVSANTDNAIVSLNWPTALEGSGFAALANNIGMARYGTDWGVFAGTGDNTANTATNTYNAFSAFTVGQVGTTLPVRFSSINAVAANNKISITWKVENETNLDSYAVEKSSDGVSFSSLEAVAAKGYSTYTSIDNNPFAGNNYYRIKAMDKSGEARYSSIVKVNMSIKGRNELSVYPNPVVNKTINLQLKDMDAGSYSLLLIDNAGQIVYTKPLGNINGTQSMALPVGQSIAAGVYQLIIKGSSQQLQQTIIIQ